MVRKKGKLVSLFILLSLVFCSSALAVDVYECTTINSSGTYVMNQSITNNTLIDNCINITVSDVVFDCNNSFIISDDGFAGIYSNGTNTTIRNCNVSMGIGGKGIELFQANNSYVYNTTAYDQTDGIFSEETGSLIIENSTAIDNGDGIVLYKAFNNTVRNCTILRNGNGVKVEGHSAGSYLSKNNLIENSVIDESTSYGFYNWYEFATTIQNNEIRYNQDRAIYWTGSESNNTVIRNNRIEHNLDDVIYLYSGNSNYVYNSTIENNIINNNSAAAYLIYLYGINLDNRIINNTLNISGFNSIHIQHTGSAGRDNNNLIANNQIYSTIYGTAVYLNGGNNTRVENNTISDAWIGIEDYTVANLTISNNTIDSTYDYGIQLNSRRSKIINNTFWNCSTGSLCIEAYSDYSYLQNNYLNFSIAAGVGIHGDHNILQDMDMSQIGGTDMTIGTSDTNNTLINVTYSGEAVYSGGELIRKWYYSAYANDTSGGDVVATIEAYNSSNDLEFSISTNESGTTNITTITDYVNNGTRQYYSLYTIYASNSSYLTNSHTYNATLNENYFNDLFTLQSGDILECQVLDSPGGTYTLTANITNNTLTDNCFNITSSNIVLDCQGYFISSYSNFSGIYAKADNLTISNCNISMGKYNQRGISIELEQASDVGIYNCSTNYSSVSIFINQSNYTVVDSLDMRNMDDYGVIIEDSIGTNFTNSQFLSSDYALLFDNCADNYVANNNFSTWYELYFQSYNNDTLIENNIFQGDDNADVSYFIDLNGLTIRNNIFRNYTSGYLELWNNLVRPDNILIENNIFEDMYIGFHGGGNDAYNVTFRNNTFNNTEQDAIEMDGVGVNVESNRFYDTGWNAIELSGSIFNVSHNIIINSGYYGMYVEDDAVIWNNTINSTGDSSIYAVGDFNITENNLWNCTYNAGVNEACIYMFSGNTGSTVSRNKLNLSSSKGLYFSSSDGVTVRDMEITNIQGEDIYLTATSQNNSFINVTYEAGAGNETISSGGELIRKWYYKAYVNDTDSNNVTNANITAFNVSDSYSFNLTTDTTGYTPLTSIIDYVNNGTRNYYSNYTIYAVNNSWVDIQLYNVTFRKNNYNHVFTLAEDASPPTINFSCSPTTVNVGETINCTCNATDTIDPDPCLDYENSPSTASAGTYDAVCYANDTAGNSANFTISYTVNSASSPSSPGGGGGSSYTPPKKNETENETKVRGINCEVTFDYPPECEEVEQCKIYYNFYDLIREDPYLGKQKSKCYFQEGEFYYTETKCDTGKPIVMEKVERGRKKDLEIYTSRKDRKKVKKQVQLTCSNYTNKTKEEIIEEVNETITDYEKNQSQNQTEEQNLTEEDKETIIIIDDIVVDTQKVIEEGRVEVNYTLIEVEKGEGEEYVANINLNELPNKLDLEILNTEFDFEEGGCKDCPEFPLEEKRKTRIILLFIIFILMMLLIYAFYRVSSKKRKRKNLKERADYHLNAERKANKGNKGSFRKSAKSTVLF